MNVEDCKHEEDKIPFPDSLAAFCPGCGAVWVQGKLVETTVKSWLDDIYGPAKDKDVD
jgi:hypothetical protein